MANPAPASPESPTPQPPDVRQAFARLIWPELARHKHKLLLGLVLNGLCGGAVAIQTMAPKWLIDDILVPELSVEEKTRRFLILAGCFLVTAIVLRMLAWHLGYRLFTWVREQVVLTLRARFFSHVNHLCLRFHADHPSTELFAYLFGSPLAAMIGFYQHVANGGAGAAMTMVATLATATAWDPLLTLVLLLCSASSVSLMQWSRRRVNQLHRDYQKTEGEISGVVGDLLRGNRAVKLHAMEQQVAEEFYEQADLIREKSYLRDIRSHIESMKQETWGYVSFAILMGAVAWRHAQGAITLGEATAFLMAYGMVQSPLNFLFNAFIQAGAAQAGLERLAAVMASGSSTPDPVEGQRRAVPPAGDLSLSGVTFGYTADRPVLHGVDLTIPYGQRVAIVGPSGSGKSTLSQLLLRLYDPDQGSIRLAGVDLTATDPTELRRRFGVVPQDPFIFRTTIRENVIVAKPGASEAEIRRALVLANAWEFVAASPLGLDTRVGEGGATLSGGQRQRLAIARALLADTPFFIFDEATSALDTLSEELIQRTLDNQLAGRTAILIAHRLATVKNCHRILVLDQGRIIQDGTFAHLMDQPGLFRELVQGQQLRG